MPLTYPEKCLLDDFLRNTDDKCLKGLAASVTEGVVNANSREEAINCLMLHTDNLKFLFDRKKMNKSLLLHYFSLKNWPIPGNSTKEVLVQTIFHKWNLPYTEPSMPSTQYMPSSMSPCQNLYQGNSPLNIMSSTPCQNLYQANSPLSIMSSNLMGNGNPLAQMVRSKELIKEVNTIALNDFIREFADMFYKLFNKPNGPLLHSFDQSHFFAECKVKIMIQGATDDIKLEAEGVNDVLSVLSSLQKDHGLHFQPNLPDQEVPYKQDSHGLICVSVCGTLHKPEGPVGVFEQAFILSRDPFAQKVIKIQETTLILRSSNAVSSYTQLMLTHSNRANTSSLALESSNSSSSAIVNGNSILAIRDVS